MEGIITICSRGFFDISAGRKIDGAVKCFWFFCCSVFLFRFDLKERIAGDDLQIASGNLRQQNGNENLFVILRYLAVRLFKFSKIFSQRIHIFFQERKKTAEVFIRKKIIIEMTSLLLLHH